MTKKPTKGGSKPASGKPGKPGGSAKKAGGAKKSKLPPWMPDLPAGKPAPARRSAPGGGSRQPSPPPRGGFRDPNAAREAERYADPIASREAILAQLAAAEGPQTAEDLAALLELTAPDRFDALGKRLGAMVRDGQLLQNRRGGYAPAKQMDLIPGVVIANPNGFGFLRPEAGGGDDLFLPPYEMRKAMHGDRVMACVTGIDRSGRREGSIVEVLERRLSRLIGRFTLEAGISYVVPDDKRVQRNVLIPPDQRGEARDGQLVVCELTQAPDARRPPMGRIIAVLGDKLTPSLVVEAAIHGHEIPYEFPQEVLDQAAAVPLVVDDSMIAGRVDLRAMPLVTIDGEDAKDFDDAVYCESNRQGLRMKNRSGYRLVVAIADVSNYVRPGTPLDDEAQKR
ncbi:MAG TPA: RNB domain-containing ribonuclease, partial [Pseudoxanthomonas sp.]